MINKQTAIEIIETSLNDISNKKIINREEKALLEQHLNSKHITALSGIRRCGKTYLLFQIIMDLMKKNKNVAYINFEDPRFDDNFEQLNIIYESFLEHKKNDGKIYFFFDEIQNIRKWEKWLAAMYEKGIKFFVSGSNTSLLTGEFSKSLSGRHNLVKIYPLGFKQFVSFKNSKLLDERLWRITEKKAELKKLLGEYLKYGGFPEVVFNGRKDILRDYFEDILTKDIISRNNLRFKQSLKELAFLLLTNISSHHSLYSLNKILNARSINTIKNYLMFLEEAYLIVKIPFFSFSVKRQLSNPFKVYSTDIGMRNSVSFRFSEDIGKIYENAVAIELIRRYEKENIFYWKNTEQEEVDFVIKKGMKISQLIQVCYEISRPETKSREVRALLKASKELKCNSLFVITEDYEGEEELSWFGIKRNIKFIPLWKWLLEKNILEE